MSKENNIEKDKIVKSNKIIEAGFSELNRNSFKLLMFLTTEMCMSTLENKENGCKVTFRHSDFTNSLGLEIDSLSYEDIKGYLNNLRKSTVELPIIENGEEVGEVLTGFILKSNVYKRGFSTVLFDEDVLSYLHYLDRDGAFTMLRYNMIKEFGSFYSMRIYELLIQWKNTKHKSVTFEIEELKNKLGAKGQYERLDNFESRVLEPAQKEINEISDILMDYEKLALGESKGKGRKPISHIKFTFKMKVDSLPQAELLTEEQVRELMEIAEQRTKGTEKTAKEYYDFAFNYTKEQLEKSKNKKGFYKYIKKSIEGENTTFLGQVKMNLDNPFNKARQTSDKVQAEYARSKKEKIEQGQAEYEKRVEEYENSGREERPETDDMSLDELRKSAKEKLRGKR